MLGSIILFFPDTVGVADNSDYYRVLQPLGLTSDKSPEVPFIFKKNMIM